MKYIIPLLVLSLMLAGCGTQVGLSGHVSAGGESLLQQTFLISLLQINPFNLFTILLYSVLPLSNSLNLEVSFW